MTKQSNSGFLASFPWESFWLGGFSLLVWCGFWLFRGRDESLLTLSYFAYAVAFAANHPHFLSSYIMLYRDFGTEITKKPRYFWAAVVAPVLLLAALGTSLATGHGDWLGYGASLMFFLVGWHYTKQVFGAVIVSSVRRKVFYSQWERKAVLANLLGLWAISWLQSQLSDAAYQFYGLTYHGLGLPVWTMTLTYAFVVASGLFAVYLHVRKYVRDGTKPATPALIALLALYAWYLPVCSHPGFAYFIPLFHSLQYLSLVWIYKKNSVTSKLAKVEGPAWRAGWVRDFIGYFAIAAALGALVFEFAPNVLDADAPLAGGSMGTRPWLACVLLFVNIHHYFIDNVLWRSDNAEIKKHLFTADAPAAAATAVEAARPKGRDRAA